MYIIYKMNIIYVRYIVHEMSITYIIYALYIKKPIYKI